MILFIITILGYYVFSFYPYIQKILNKVEKVNINKEQLEDLHELIVLEKQMNLKAMKSNMSVNLLLRKQVFISIYNEEVINSQNKKKYWKLDRWLWSYISYVNFNNEAIVRLYLYYRVYPKHINIIKYSETFFGKDIKDLTSIELEKLYEMGY